jgi:hypothetical protein
MSSAATAATASAASAPGSIFHTNRTAALVPKEARNKSLLRKAIHDFADQFAAVLAHRLISYCQLRNSKTVDIKTLKRAAEDLLGAGAGDAPAGVNEADIPQTMIFSRFKKSLGGLRMEGGCAVVASSIGFNFLRHVQDVIDGVYSGAADAKAVEAEAVIAQLERSHGHSPAGLPCIAYRPGLVVDVSAAPKRKKEVVVADDSAADDSAAAPAPAATKGKGKKAAAAQAESAAAPAAAAAPTKGKKRAAVAVAAEAGVAVAEEAPKPKGKAKGKAAVSAAAAVAVSDEAAEVAEEPKRRKKAPKAAKAAAGEQ